MDGNPDRDRNGPHDDTDYGRNRALLFALTVTFVLMVAAKIIFSLYWYGALLFAVVVFGLMFALFLRIRRNSM